MQNPCKTNVSCQPCGDGLPITVNNSESNDVATFTAVAFQSPPLPLGTAFSSLGAVSVVTNATSQADADLLAKAQAQENAMATWTNPENGPGPGGTHPNPPVPPPEAPTGGAPFNHYRNTEQTGSAVCPDGTDFYWTTPAGLFTGTTQAIADEKALSYANHQAGILVTCLSNLLPSTATANVPYNATITVTGMDANEGANNWEVLSGMLPPGITFSGSGVTGTFAGTPTVAGIYNFSIGVTGIDGGFVQKFYQLGVMCVLSGGSLPAGVAGTAYSYTFTSQGTVAPVFSIISGALPAGLSMDQNGNITGTPLAAGAGTSNFVVQAQDAGSPAVVCTIPASIAITVPAINFNLMTWGTPTLFNGSSPPNNQSSSGNAWTANLIAVPVAANFLEWEFLNVVILNYTGAGGQCEVTVTGSLPQQLCNGTPISNLLIHITHQTAGLILNVAAAVPGTTYPFTMPASVNQQITMFIGFTVNQRCTATPANVEVQLFPAYN